WYQANSEKKPSQWAKKRYQEIVEHHCFVNPSHLSMKSVKGLRHRLKQPRYLLPLSLVIVVSVLAWFHKLQSAISWCQENPKTASSLFLGLLIFLRLVNGNQVIKAVLDKFLGEGKEEKK